MVIICGMYKTVIHCYFYKHTNTHDTRDMHTVVIPHVYSSVIRTAAYVVSIRIVWKITVIKYRIVLVYKCISFNCATPATSLCYLVTEPLFHNPCVEGSRDGEGESEVRRR